MSNESNERASASVAGAGNVVSVNGIPTCKHPREQTSIGPTTSQINHYCPDCRQGWVTFPDASGEALTTCNCRWKGEKLVQQCTLHEAWRDAIRDWSERAKTAESALAARPAAEADDSVGFTREQWVSHAARVYRACGDTEAEAERLAEALADEQDWYGELDEPFEMALADVEGRPVAEGEAASLPDAFWEALQRLIENAAVQGPASVDDARLVGRYRDRLAALARQAPAPLPQAVPEGWKLERDTGGGAIIINGPNDVGGCVAYREPIAGRMIPEAILFALADSLLSRHPQPQAVTEDARDGEREHSPDDMTVPKPTADLKVGDYVFACRWSDGEPGDPWSVGWIDEINLSSVIVPFVVLRGSPRGWRHAMKITEEQGHRICALYPEAESRPHQERLAVRAKAFGLAARATTSGSEGEGR